MESLIGQKVSHDNVVRRLGSGGMSVVDEAEDSSLGRRVALKFLPDETAEDVQSELRHERHASPGHMI